MKSFRLCIVLALFLGVASVAQAQADAPPRASVSGFGSFALSAETGLDRGHGGGFAAAYFFSPVIGVEGSFTLRTFDVTTNSGNELSGGELTSNVVNLNFVGRFEAGSARPYVSGGMSFFMNDYAIDPAVEAALAQFNFTPNETIDNAIGFNVGGGVDFAFSDRVGAFVEGRYSFGSSNTTGGLIDQLSGVEATSVGKQELGTFAVNGGVRIFFQP